MRPMDPTEEEALDPRDRVLNEIQQWAKLGEADGMRSRNGRPPRPPMEDEMGGEPGMEMADPMEPDPELGDALGGELGEEGIPGVEPTEDGEAPPAGGDEALDEEQLKALLAAMGG